MKVKVRQCSKAPRNKKFQRRNDPGYKTLTSVNILFSKQIDQVAFQTHLLKYGLLLDIHITQKTTIFKVLDNNLQQQLKAELHRLEDNQYYVSRLELFESDVIYLIAQHLTTRFIEWNVSLDYTLKTLLTYMRDIHIEMIKYIPNDYDKKKRTMKYNKLIKLLKFYFYLKEYVLWDGIIPTLIRE